MNLFDDGPATVAARPPETPKGLAALTEPERAGLRETIQWAMTQEPDVLARVLSVAVVHLGPSALQRAARMILDETGRRDA